MTGRVRVQVLAERSGSASAAPLPFVITTESTPRVQLIVPGEDGLQRRDLFFAGRLAPGQWIVSQREQTDFFVQTLQPVRPLPEIYQQDLAYAACLHGDRSIRIDVPMGMCSMDQRPREALRDAARQAAVRGEWFTFLQAHLRLLNDHVERASDGSYAWAERDTYVAELERIQVDVVGLLLGTLWQAKDPDKAVVQGAHWRLGRALASAREGDLAVFRLLEAVGDTRLDPLNRSLALWTLGHLIGWSEPQLKTQRLAQLQALRFGLDVLEAERVRILSQLSGKSD